MCIWLSETCLSVYMKISQFNGVGYKIEGAPPPQILYISFNLVKNLIFTNKT